MTQAGMMLLTLFALGAGFCLWLYWKTRQDFRRYVDELHAAKILHPRDEAALLRKIQAGLARDFFGEDSERNQR